MHILTWVESNIDYISHRGTEYSSTRMGGENNAPRGSNIINVALQHSQHLFCYKKKRIKNQDRVCSNLRPAHYLIKMILLLISLQIFLFLLLPLYPASFDYLLCLNAFYDLACFWVNESTYQVQFSEIVGIFLDVVSSRSILKKCLLVTIFGRTNISLIDYFSI